jgi:hypothetical protein
LGYGWQASGGYFTPSFYPENNDFRGFAAGFGKF